MVNHQVPPPEQLPPRRSCLGIWTCAAAHTAFLVNIHPMLPRTFLLRRSAAATRGRRHHARHDGARDCPRSTRPSDVVDERVAADEAAMLLLVTLVLLMTSAQHLHNLVRISGLNHQPCHGMPASCCCARGAVRAFPSWLTRAALPRRCSTADPRAQCCMLTGGGTRAARHRRRARTHWRDVGSRVVNQQKPRPG